MCIRDRIKRIIYKQAIRISCIGIPIGLLLGAVAVSYTHLDVYKRQVKKLPRDLDILRLSMFRKALCIQYFAKEIGRAHV